jgi:hypothetical protein
MADFLIAPVSPDEWQAMEDEFNATLAKFRSVFAKMKPAEETRFICNICGIRVPHAVLCVKEGCPTETLVYGHTRKF